MLKNIGFRGLNYKIKSRQGEYFLYLSYICTAKRKPIRPLARHHITQTNQMNTLASTAKLLTISLALSAGLASCGGNQAASTSAASPASASADAPAKLNIRFIDGDSIATRYNLAKDFQEVSLRAFSKIDAARQSKANAINNLAGQIQQKAQNNGYLTETSYNADMTKLSRMQQEAETSLASMQRSTEQELAQMQQAITDSINSFINDYNKKKGYDAILYRAAGVYFNPELDITDEVVEGLNARYNKVEKSKE